MYSTYPSEKLQNRCAQDFKYVGYPLSDLETPFPLGMEKESRRTLERDMSRPFAAIPHKLRLRRQSPDRAPSFVADRGGGD